MVAVVHERMLAWEVEVFPHTGSTEYFTFFVILLQQLVKLVKIIFIDYRSPDNVTEFNECHNSLDHHLGNITNDCRQIYLH